MVRAGMGIVSEFKPKSFPYGTHKHFGDYCYRRGTLVKTWRPNEEVWRAGYAKSLSTISHFFLRSQDGYATFFYSPMCARDIAEIDPDLYCKIHNLSYGSEHYALFQAWRIKNKIEENSNGTTLTQCAC